MYVVIVSCVNSRTNAKVFCCAWVVCVRLQRGCYCLSLRVVPLGPASGLALGSFLWQALWPFFMCQGIKCSAEQSPASPGHWSVLPFLEVVGADMTCLSFLGLEMNPDVYQFSLSNLPRSLHLLLLFCFEWSHGTNTVFVCQFPANIYDVGHEVLVVVGHFLVGLLGVQQCTEEEMYTQFLEPGKWLFISM